MTHAARSAATATHMVCAMAGTTSIFTSSPLERYARDAEVVTRHKQREFVNYEAVGAPCSGSSSLHLELSPERAERCGQRALGVDLPLRREIVD
jgi:Acyl-CoA dehydrogenase, C-terminal domain